MKKAMLITILLFLITGCSSQYNLKIDGDKISEEINFNIDKSKIVEEDLGAEMDIYSKESINYLKNDNIYPIIDNNTEKYKKQVTEDNNYINVILNYKYTVENYSKSQFLSNCFEKYDVRETKKEIYIHLSGKFNCLNDSNSLDFVIESGNKIFSNNADNKISNKYTWNINSSNKNNIDIEIKLSKQSLFQYYLWLSIAGIFIIVLVVLSINTYHKIRNRYSINEV